MRLGMSLQIPGDNKKPDITRPLTLEMYFAWVNRLPVNESIRDKFRGLVNKMPSTALRSVVNNSNTFIRRFETEVNDELYGLVNSIEASKPNPIEVKNGNEDVEEKEGWHEVSKCEVVNPYQVYNFPSEGSDQGGRTVELERQASELHPDVSGGDICGLRSDGELSTGCEPAKEGSSTTTGECSN